MSSRTGKLVFALVSSLLWASMMAMPKDIAAAGAKQSAVKAVAHPSVISQKDTAAILTSEQRARAVRASLIAALTPDPVAMGALLFCAFALRWLRLRREQQQGTEAPVRTTAALPGAA